MFAGLTLPAHDMSLTVMGATLPITNLARELPTLLMCFPTFVGVTAHNELTRFVRVLNDAEHRMVHHLINILGPRTIRASQCLPPVMTAEFVLILRRLIRVQHSTKFTDTSSNAGKFVCET